MKKLSMTQKKKRMIAFRDLLGQDIPDTKAIKNAKNDKDLHDILNQHTQFLEAQLSDTIASVEHFERSLDLEY